MDVNKFPLTSLKEIYRGLPTRKQIVHPRKELIKHLAEITYKSEKTVYTWLSGEQTPDALAQSVIEKDFGIPASILFPANN